MPTLADIQLPARERDVYVDPEVWASIFDTDEMHVLQDRVCQVKEVVDLALSQTGAEIIHGTFGHSTSGALALKFNVEIPQEIVTKFDNPHRYFTGALYSDGRVNGEIKIGAGNLYKDSFMVEFYTRGVGTLGRSDIHLPKSPDNFRMPVNRVETERARLTILGIAAAATHARELQIPLPISMTLF